jgi:hypothetical protein
VRPQLACIRTWALLIITIIHHCTPIYFNNNPSLYYHALPCPHIIYTQAAHSCISYHLHTQTSLILKLHTQTSLSTQYIQHLAFDTLDTLCSTSCGTNHLATQ